MNTIIRGDFIYLNPDLNQCKYRNYHGRRMEVLSVNSDGTLNLLGNAIYPLTSAVVLQEDYLKAVVLIDFIRRPDVPFKVLPRIFDALVRGFPAPVPVELWAPFKSLSQRLTIHLESSLETLTNLVQEDGSLF